MSNKKRNNKLLIGILVGLILLFFITDFFKERDFDEHSLPDKLLEILPHQVESINIFKKGGNDLYFSKSSEKWQIENKNTGVTSDADKDAISLLLQKIAGASPQKLVSKSDKNRDRYQVTDSLATILSLTLKGMEKARLYLGKVNSGVYVRVGGQSKVYGIDASLLSQLEKSFNSWRNHNFTNLNPEDITRVLFSYSNEKVFELKKSDSIWKIGDRNTNIKSVERYLGSFKDKKIDDFADGFTPSENVAHRVTFYNTKTEGEVVIKHWKSENKHVLSSSLNPDTYFSVDTDDALKELFPKEDDLYSTEQK